MVDLDSKEAITALRAKERLKGLSPLQMIKEYYSSDLPIQLPDHVEEIRIRLNLVVRLQCKQLSKFSIINKLRKVFDISERQAYRDLDNALTMFGETQDATKNGKRIVVEEMLSASYRSALRSGNTKQMIEASKALMKLNGLDREDIERPDFSNLKQSVWVVVMEPKTDKLFQDFIDSGGSIDVSKFMNSIADDAEQASLTQGGTDSSD